MGARQADRRRRRSTPDADDVHQHVELSDGDADDILDPAMSKSLAERLPDCTLHTWPGAGQYGVYRRGQEFLSAIV